ncbi:hypothetical protein DFH07DRAFT_998970 [Mycena maculata]|uniref:Uncharacterized protein n=1 Tax=Mycena maculata TaxID=230809 RepID=A0AAD7HTX3_9AGAR|nr:hypothetical protein DFH07DRAFT_998970 [Mycena maculata]
MEHGEWMGSSRGVLLRNYLNDTSGDGHGFSEISGSSLLAAVTYCMVVLAPTAFSAATYVPWADSIRAELGMNDADGNPHITNKRYLGSNEFIDASSNSRCKKHRGQT